MGSVFKGSIMVMGVDGDSDRGWADLRFLARNTVR